MVTLKEYLFSLGLLSKDAPKHLVKEAKLEFKRNYNKQYQKRYKEKVHRVNVLLKSAEYKELENSAKRHKQKITPHIKRLALAYLHQEFLTPNEQAIQDLQLEIKAIGRNINQIAKRVNTYGSAHFNKLELLSHIDQLDRLIADRLENPVKLYRDQLSSLHKDYDC